AHLAFRRKVRFSCSVISRAVTTNATPEPSFTVTMSSGRPAVVVPKTRVVPSRPLAIHRGRLNSTSSTSAAATSCRRMWSSAQSVPPHLPIHLVSVLRSHCTVHVRRRRAFSQLALSRSGHTGRVRILVVDDDRPVRESLRRSLAFNGYEVDLASDGQQALTR